MKNERQFLVGLGSLVVVGLGLVILAGFYVAGSKDPPPALWSLLAAVTGGILAALPGFPRQGKED